MRFEETTSDVEEIMKERIKKYFPELISCKISTLFDKKKRLKGGNIVLASIQKPNEMLRYFTIDNAGTDEGYDYVMRIDKNAWSNIEKIDKERLIRHELRHTLVDFDSDNPYKLRDHSITDFYSEVKLNEDDARWVERVGSLTLAIYEDK
jgi:hypothetical protein